MECSHAAVKPDSINHINVKLQDCRVCLQDGSIMLTRRINPLDFPLIHYLQLICGVTITANDSHPQNLCEVCYDVLRSAINLRKMALKTQLQLKIMTLNQINIDNTGNKIKNEPKLSILMPSIQKYMCNGTEMESERKLYNYEFDEVSTKSSPLREEMWNNKHDNIDEIKDKTKKQPLETPCLKYDQELSKTDQNLPTLTLELIQQLRKNKKLTEAYFKKDFGGTLKYQCRICKKFYKLHSTFDHLLTHLPTTASQYICEVCGKSFKKYCVFFYHQRVHKNELLFNCKLCSYKGRTKSGLQIHTKRVHTREYKYQCSVCPKRYLGPSDLNYHLRRHGEPKFKCETCHKFFYEISTLRVHIQSHTAMEPLKCNVCGNLFKNRKNLLSHQVKIHKRKQVYNSRAFYHKLEHTESEEVSNK